MGLWLREFAYHIELAWWIFAVGGLGAMTLTLLTIGSQALKTAFANPAKNIENGLEDFLFSITAQIFAVDHFDSKAIRQRSLA